MEGSAQCPWVLFAHRFATSRCYIFLRREPFRLRGFVISTLLVHMRLEILTKRIGKRCHFLSSSCTARCLILILYTHTHTHTYIYIYTHTYIYIMCVKCVNSYKHWQQSNSSVVVAASPQILASDAAVSGGLTMQKVSSEDAEWDRRVQEMKTWMGPDLSWRKVLSSRAGGFLLGPGQGGLERCLLKRAP